MSCRPVQPNIFLPRTRGVAQRDDLCEQATPIALERRVRRLRNLAERCDRSGVDLRILVLCRQSFFLALDFVVDVAEGRREAPVAAGRELVWGAGTVRVVLRVAIHGRVVLVRVVEAQGRHFVRWVSRFWRYVVPYV